MTKNDDCPHTLLNENEKTSVTDSSAGPSFYLVCTTKKDNIEISFFNGTDEMVMKELKLL
ncbi:hypothetical protein FC692_29925 [Bacillus cereus]|nr:hypothetical protein FC692_29925 [Bacillus cereus]